VVVRCYELEEAPICYPKECPWREELRRAGIECVYSFGNREVGKFKVLGIGFRGVVFLARWKDTDVAVKVPRSDRVYDMRREASLQRRAYPVAPEVYDFSKHYIVMEYVSYPDIADVVNLPGDKLRPIIRRVLEAGFKLDRLGIDHGELVRPWKHVRVGDGVKILDFGSASEMRRPSNLTSLVSGLLLKPSEPARSLAGRLDVDKARMIEALRIYKKEYDKRSFLEVLKAARLL